MIKKLFDRYYLIVMRGFENSQWREVSFDSHIALLMSMTITINVVALIVMLINRLFVLYYPWFFIAFGIIILAMWIVIGAIYNEKRRQELRETYEDESLESRHRGVAWVVVYEVFSILFMIFAFWIMA
jgi:FlaA1/EpsC-like NDP-sugar epimerase